MLGLPHAAGVGLHDHHLVWFAALLAMSPCGDAMAWGRWYARPVPSMAYGLPIRAVWLMLAAVYFWPGFWKLATSGLAWVTGDNVLNLMHWKWAQSWDFEPWLRPDRVPGLPNVGAALAVLFELSAPLLVLSARGRWVMLGAGLLFHACTAAVLDIRFDSLWLCYVALVPWHRMTSRVMPPAPEATMPRMLPAMAALVLAVWAAGARGETRGWPLACYPTFATLAPPTMPTLLVEVHGRPVRLERYAEPSPALWAEVWRLVGIGGPVDPAALERFWRRHHPDARGEVRFYRAEMAVDPAKRDQALQRVRLLHVMSTGHPDSAPAAGPRRRR